MNKNKKSDRISVLSSLEEFAFYGFPDFDDEQRSTYFSFSDLELGLISIGPSLSAKVYFALQLGYFKAKNIYFRFSFKTVPKDDLHYIMSQYFQDQDLGRIEDITKHKYYLQREVISQFFGYKLWSNEFLNILINRARLIVKRDISPNFIANELLNFLQDSKIIRPGYSTLQDVVSQTLSEERYRLKACFQKHLTESDKQTLKQLIKNETTISELAALKQDAKSFGYKMMGFERTKHSILKPLYYISKNIMQYLDISKQNIAHYASLAHHYTVYDLLRFTDEQTYLYLLCYVFKRYQQVNDNLVDAFNVNVKKWESAIKGNADSQIIKDHDKMDKNIGKLLLLYVDDDLNDSLTLGEARNKAFDIIPKDTIRTLGEKLMNKKQRMMDLQWKERDKEALRYKHNLRPLFMAIDFESKLTDSHLLKAINWMKSVFNKKQSLSQQPFDNFQCEFISRRLKSYLITDEKDGKTVNANRYEILVYRQILNQMEKGALHIEDSIKHRTFAHELVPIDKCKDAIKNLNIPWFKTPCNEQIDSLFKELDTLWI